VHFLPWTGKPPPCQRIRGSDETLSRRVAKDRNSPLNGTIDVAPLHGPSRDSPRRAPRARVRYFTRDLLGGHAADHIRSADPLLIVGQRGLAVSGGFCLPVPWATRSRNNEFAAPCRVALLSFRRHHFLPARFRRLPRCVGKHRDPSGRRVILPRSLCRSRPPHLPPGVQQIALRQPSPSAHWGF